LAQELQLEKNPQKSQKGRNITEITSLKIIFKKNEEENICIFYHNF
jgi:hypothetical protein